MKRNYIKPEMRVVDLQFSTCMLADSGVDPKSYNNSTMGIYRGGDEKLTDDDLDDIF